MGLTTTFRHDYQVPVTNRYLHLNQKAKEILEKKEEDNSFKPCVCSKPARKEQTPITKTKAEWTGIAPLGKLVEPRIIPAVKEVKGRLTKFEKCMVDEPNRFLSTLESCYPRLYSQVKRAQENEVKKKINPAHFKTTYQIDYCGLPEYPSAVYKPKVVAALDMNKQKLIDGCSKYLNAEKCKEYDAQAKTCDDLYKPFGINFAEGPALSPPIRASHWTLTHDLNPKQEYLSEFMDKISRMGCLIKRFNVHDHAYCKATKKCYHTILDD